jgi:hypothetical protein
VLYASNVEFYLYREGSFGQFVANLERLPRMEGALIIRSVFGSAAQAPPGYGSTSLVQPVAELLAGYENGRYAWYGQLIAP